MFRLWILLLIPSIIWTRKNYVEDFNAGAGDSNSSTSYFSMGLNTLKVPMTLFAENRARLVARLVAAGAGSGEVVLLQGGGDQGICAGDSSDVGPVFRQGPNTNKWEHF